MLASRAQAQIVARDEDSPLRRLEPVTDIGQGPVHDRAHGISEVRILQFLFDLQVLDSVVRPQVRGGLLSHFSLDLAP